MTLISPAICINYPLVCHPNECFQAFLKCNFKKSNLSLLYYFSYKRKLNVATNFPRFLINFVPVNILYMLLKMKNRLLYLSVFLLLTAMHTTIKAQKYPLDGGVIDVTQPPYNADKTGILDATAAINKALDDYPNMMAIIYLPEGTYLISNTLKWPGYERGSYGNEILEGDGIDKTIIKLKNNCEGFTTPGSPKEMIHTGTDPAQRFRIALRSLTINTGTGNAGAIGARFMANNQGGVFDVKIVSGDGNGIVGLDLSYVDENGPLLVKNLEVDGFNYGIKCYAGQNSQTFEHIILKNQKICGLYSQSQVISIRDLKSMNSVTAVNNANNNGVITIIGAELTGGSTSTPAIINNSVMYLRDIESVGYNKIVRNLVGNRLDVLGSSIDEWTSHRKYSLFEGTPSSMLKLEIKETPLPTIDPLDQWSKVTSTGGDDTKNIQDAIDAGKSTVYFPRGNYNLYGKVYVRGNVQRIVGLEASINITSSSGFIVEEGSAPVVVIERFTSGYTPGFLVTQNSSRIVVVRNACNIAVKKNAGTGDLFLEDITSNPSSFFEFHGGNIWARQFNVENSGTHVINDGANLWILGMKNERDGILIETKNGGKTELLGYFCYTTMAPADIMFVNNESFFSAIGSETCYAPKGYNTLLKEINGGITKFLLSSEMPFGIGNGHASPFLVSGGMSAIQPTEINILLDTVRLMPFQDTALVINFLPADASNKTIKWSTTNNKIAFVDQFGKITALDYGTAFVVATTEDGLLRDSCQITVTDTAFNSIQSIKTSNIDVYPNPVTNKIQIALDENWFSRVTISLYNAAGQEVMLVKKHASTVRSALVIDMSRLQNGLYLLKVEDGTHVARKTLIVNR